MVERDPTAPTEPKRQVVDPVTFQTQNEPEPENGQDKFLGDKILIDPNRLLEESIKTAVGTAVGFYVTNVFLDRRRK